MAIDLTGKSAGITNREATPKVLNSPGVGGRASKSWVKDSATVGAAISITSIIRMVSVPAHCYLSDVKFASAAQGAGKFDIGIYRTNADGGAVVDQDFLATAVDCASAVAITDVTNESTTYTVAKQQQPLWQASGITTEPAKGTMLDICLVVVTTDVTTGTGVVGLEAGYYM